MIAPSKRSGCRASRMLIFPDSAVSSCTITSGSADATARATASGSRASATTGRAPTLRSRSCFAALLVIPTTSWPSATSMGTSCLPRAPVAPATKTFMTAPFVSSTHETKQSVSCDSGSALGAQRAHVRQRLARTTVTPGTRRATIITPTRPGGLGPPCRSFSEDEREDDDRDDHALSAVHCDPDPGAAVALRRIREDEGVEQRRRNGPRHVQVVAGEQDPVGHPVAASEGTVHARQEQAAEEQFLAEHGVEDEKDEDEAEPAPVAAHEALTGVGPEKGAHVAVRGSGNTARDQLFGRKGDDQRDQDQPDPAAEAAAARAPRGTEPKRFADRRPAEGALFVPDEDRDKDELPDQTGGEAHDKRLRHRHVALAGEAVLERGRGEPGKRRHRKGRGRPCREDREQGTDADYDRAEPDRGRESVDERLRRGVAPVARKH